MEGSNGKRGIWGRCWAGSLAFAFALRLVRVFSFALTFAFRVTRPRVEHHALRSCVRTFISPMACLTTYPACLNVHTVLALAFGSLPFALGLTAFLPTKSYVS